MCCAVLVRLRKFTDLGGTSSHDNKLKETAVSLLEDYSIYLLKGLKHNYKVKQRSISSSHTAKVRKIAKLQSKYSLTIICWWCFNKMYLEIEKNKLYKYIQY